MQPSNQQEKQVSEQIRRAYAMGKFTAYVLPVMVVLVIPMVISFMLNLSRSMALVSIGIGTLVYAGYFYYACRCRKTHMFFAIRLSHRIREIPDEIDWNTINKLDTTAMPMVYVVLAIAMMALGMIG